MGVFSHDAGAFIRACRAEIGTRGLDLSLGSDFREFHAVNRAAGRGPLTPILDAYESDVSARNGFWVLGENEDGEICHVQAARLLPSGSVKGELECRIASYASAGLGIDPNRSTVMTGCKDTGRLVYHGEVWLREDMRGRGLAGLLIRLMMFVSLVNWRADVFFGLSLPHTSSPKFTSKMGYRHLDPVAVRWRDQTGETVRDEGLVWSTKADAAAMLSRPQERDRDILRDLRETSQPVIERQESSLVG